MILKDDSAHRRNHLHGALSPKISFQCLYGNGGRADGLGSHYAAHHSSHVRIGTLPADTLVYGVFRSDFISEQGLLVLIQFEGCFAEGDAADRLVHHHAATGRKSTVMRGDHNHRLAGAYRSNCTFLAHRNNLLVAAGPAHLLVGGVFGLQGNGKIVGAAFDKRKLLLVQTDGSNRNKNFRHTDLANGLDCDIVVRNGVNLGLSGGYCLYHTFRRHGGHLGILGFPEYYLIVGTRRRHPGNQLLGLIYLEGNTFSIQSNAGDCNLLLNAGTEGQQQ